MQKFIAKHHYFPVERQWIGVIIDTKSNQIVTMGVEFCKEDIIKWCQTTLEIWPVCGIEAPDAFDRNLLEA